MEEGERQGEKRTQRGGERQDCRVIGWLGKVLIGNNIPVFTNCIHNTYYIPIPAYLEFARTKNQTQTGTYTPSATGTAGGCPGCPWTPLPPVHFPTTWTVYGDILIYLEIFGDYLTLPFCSLIWFAHSLFLHWHDSKMELITKIGY